MLLRLTAFVFLLAVSAYGQAFGNGPFGGGPFGGNASVYYVNLATGSDANNGLAAVAGGGNGPWLTIDHADGAITPGAGGAHVYVTGSVSRTTTLQTGHSGTSSARITWDGQGTSTITWTGNTSAGACWLIGSSTSTGSYVTVQGFNLTGSCATGVGIRGDVDNVLSNKIHDLDGTGGSPSSACPATAAIQQIATYDTNPGLGLVIGDVGGSISGNTINQIGASPNSACAEWHGIYQKFPHTTIQNNIISNVTSGWGMQFGGFGCYTTVSGNTFFKNEQGNIILYVETWSGDTAAVNQCPAATFSHVAITNNISIDVINSNGAERGPGIATFGAFCSGTVGTDNVIKNFLSYGNAGGNFKDNCSPATGLALLNIFSDASETATFTNWQANGSGTYSLLAGSNAIRNGSTTCPTSLPGCYPTTDITGANRSIPISIGAYDFSILPPPTAPNNFSIAGNITTSGYIGQ